MKTLEQNNRRSFIEDNRLIAEFMPTDWLINGSGFSYQGRFIDPIVYDDHCKEYGSFYYPEDMRYHTSWDWLMPVVEKIEQPNGTGYENFVHILGCGCFIENLKPNEISETIVEPTEPLGTKLEMTYKAVIQFIEWYNENKND